jgi:two-component system sensor histidine kinase QseC
VISIRDLSLSQRLLVGLLIVTFAFWAVIAALTIRDSIDDTYELFDAHLTQTAIALLSVAEPGEGQPQVTREGTEQPTLGEIFGNRPEVAARVARSTRPGGDVAARADRQTLPSLNLEYEKLLRYQIWSSDGRLLLRSANAPAEVMAEHDGFSETSDVDGRTWRHFSIWDQRFMYRVQVSEAHDVRNRLVRDIALHVVSPLALGLPVLVFLLWFSVSRGLDPLGRLTHQIEEKKPDNLLPLEVQGVPKELRPVVLALNRLLVRVAHALDSERRLTANAAHELRTPLAAIQAHLHAARGADDRAVRQGAMNQLQRSVERGIRLVGQLLALARLDPEQKLPDPEQVDVAAVAEAVGAELAPLALAKDQTLELRVETGLPSVPGNPDLLSILLANLVDNAIRYTQRNGHIDIDIRHWQSGVEIEVSDDGPGIPEAQRDAVFERFYRIAGQDQPGSGLGLAIARRVVELHDAMITVGDGPGNRGLTMTIFLKGDPEAAAGDGTPPGR